MMERVPGPYRTLLFRLGKDLESGDFRDMKFLLTTDALRPGLQPEDMIRIKDFYELIFWMEAKDLLSPNNLSDLRSLLHVIGRRDLITKHLLVYERRYGVLDSNEDG